MSLKKELGLAQIYCMATGAMISSGIFVLPGLAHAMAGPAVILSYVLAGLLAGIGMLSAAELATAMPRAGGDYFFITRAMGPAAGTASGMLNWFSISLKSAFALVGMAAFTRLFIPVDIRIIGLVLTAVFTAINILSTRHAGRLQVTLVVGLLMLMLYFVVRGMPHVRMDHLMPFAPYGEHRILATAGFVFVAYGGLIKISGVAEEVRQPGRTIPLGMILALLTVMAMYTLMVWIATGILPHDQLNGSLMPITDAARTFMAPWEIGAVSLAAILAFVSTANAGIMAASRYLLAMSRDGLVPGPFARIHPRFHTPHAALLMTGAFVALSLFLKLEVLVEAASLVLILAFVLSNLCVIILRESRVENYRPSFRAPLYPYLQIAGLAGFILLIFEMGLAAYSIILSLVLVSVLAYALYGSRQAHREYALLHLIERITARDLVTGSLERELKEILRERDDVVLDRFDRIIADCPVIDLDEAMDYVDGFRIAAERLAEPVGMKVDALQQLLVAREEESSTALTDFLAIPHVVLPGEKQFHILLVRSREGLRFSGDNEHIHAVVFLLGTRDERNFHLKVIANLAQITQSADFEKRWLAARTEQGLRDVILLGARQRS